MRIRAKVFVGFDHRQPEAFEACVESIIQHGRKPEDIKVLNRDLLEKEGLYWRKDAKTESTEFAFTRFLVPYLKGYDGYAIFCDSDFIWQCDPFELLSVIDEKKAVSVVQHDIKPEQLSATKMNGKPQVWYPRKNWTSLMVFNCAHVACKRLMPEVVSEAPPDYLHGLRWGEDYLGKIPHTYNYLVGYYNDIKNPKAIHYTDGGPWHPGYESVEFADVWERYANLALKRQMEGFLDVQR